MATKKKIKQINLIPLINIIFLMLIFFMLAGTITTIDPHKVSIPDSIIKNDFDFENADRNIKREIFKRYPDTSKAKSLIGFEATVGLEEALRKVIDSQKKH